MNGGRGPFAQRSLRVLFAARSISYFGTYLADVRDFRLSVPEPAEAAAPALAT